MWHRLLRAQEDAQILQFALSLVEVRPCGRPNAWEEGEGE